MSDFSEDTATDIVLSCLAACHDERLKEVMSSVVRHLHAVVREVEPTQEEWMAAIGFLTATGQICDDKRQEWILLSDTLGVSMLIDAINHRKPKDATQSTVLGPFHVAGAPILPLGANISKDGRGEPLEQLEPLRASILAQPAAIPTGDAAIINDEGRILLVQRADNLKWAMPGGVTEVGNEMSYG